MTTETMLKSHPAAGSGTADLAVVVDDLLACLQACTSCADACLAEDGVDHLRRCIRLDQDCADVCSAAVRVLSRQGDSDAATLAALLSACIAACAACAEECASHADMHEHCRACAEACRRCEASCRRMLETLG